MTTFLLVAAGGAIGAVLRYYTTLLTAVAFRESKIFTGTVMANIIGCFLAGSLFAVYQGSELAESRLITFLTIGVLGSYTTFSTFSLELFERLTESFRNLAAYLFMQLVTALGAVLAGYFIILKIMEGS